MSSMTRGWISGRSPRTRFAIAITAGAIGLMVHLNSLWAAGITKRIPSKMSASQIVATSWWSQNGGRFQAGTIPTLPAILLIHGNHESAADWTQPSHMDYNYDYRNAPSPRSLGSKSYPGTGIFKVGRSDKMDVDRDNWFDFLSGKGFTVATYTQRPGTIAEVLDQSDSAYVQFMKDTAGLNPTSPPPVAVIAHSRGGLVIRHVLKREGGMGRLRWVITIHSPHQGSEMARVPERIADEAVAAVGGAHLPGPAHDALRTMVMEMARHLYAFIDDQSRELAPGSKMLQDLEKGERPVENVRYFTFGGTNPNYYRFYTWVFTPGSAVPQYHGLKQYFKWEVKAVEIGPASPMYASVRHIAPEITPEQGDGLVADQAARLPSYIPSTHETDQLNHAEIFWNRPLQQRVVQILMTPVSPVTASGN